MEKLRDLIGAGAPQVGRRAHGACGPDRATVTQGRCVKIRNGCRTWRSLLRENPSIEQGVFEFLEFESGLAFAGSGWELSIPKPFLKPGAFHLQQIRSVSVAYLMRRLGELSEEEWGQVTNKIAERLSF